MPRAWCAASLAPAKYLDRVDRMNGMEKFSGASCPQSSVPGGSAGERIGSACRLRRRGGSMNGELVRVTTTDGVHLAGMLRQPATSGASTLPVDIVILHHGV